MATVPSLPLPPPLPIYSWRTHSPNARLSYIRTPNEANAEIALLKKGAVGFDLEWKPNYQKGRPENPVALVQLATRDRILLLQISAMRVIPNKLAELLLDPEYIKTGVGIQNDVLKLYRDWNVSTHACVDLSLLARTVDNARWKGKYSQPIGLARLLEAYHGHTLTKGRITRSNWETILSIAQQEYAGNDAHAGLVLYDLLSSMIPSMVKPPKPIYYSFHAVRGNLYNSLLIPWACNNPDYDPGPPPPKMSKPGHDKILTAQPDAPTSDLTSAETKHFVPSTLTHEGNTTTPVTSAPHNSCETQRSAGPHRSWRTKGYLPSSALPASPALSSLTLHTMTEPRSR